MAAADALPRLAEQVHHEGRIPRGADHDPTSRLTKVFGPKRAPRRCGASRSVRDAVRKPWYAAVAVA